MHDAFPYKSTSGRRRVLDIRRRGSSTCKPLPPCASLIAFILPFCLACPAAFAQSPSPVDLVNPMIGSSNGGNTYPGAVMPFGMLAWSPEGTRGKHSHTASPSGYAYDARRIRGFSLTHASGAGCAGLSGDVPFMPVTVPVTSSPSTDTKDSLYASDFKHGNETARAGDYRVRLANGVKVQLTAALHSGMGRFSFPQGKPANLLIRASDSEVGSSDAHVSVDRASRTVTGSVTSGNFCGYLSKADQKSYYTLYFVAHFDQPFKATGTWHNTSVHRGGTSTSGGTTYGKKGWPPAGRGSGAWISFSGKAKHAVNMRVGISYVSLANAKANLKAEIPQGTRLSAVKKKAHRAWNRALNHIDIKGGTLDQRTTFYTALYHALLHPNVFSDVNGEYRGMDQKIHRIQGTQKVQYANFSGWDVYRSQLQLVTFLYPQRGGDIAQSLFNQARQNHGEWDRWTHNSGGTHVMSGDPAAPALADIVAFGGWNFDMRDAYASLEKAATHVTAHDLSDAGCNVECVGERPSLDDWMKLHYIPSKSHAWGGAGETLEDATADFALSRLARRVGDTAGEKRFLKRSGYWKNLFNPNATAHGGYIQNRNADGSWPAFTPDTGDGFVEGSASVYLWMVPFDEHGLFDKLGGKAKAARRLDDFFHTRDGRWALTKAGPLHAELDNEPSVETPWLFDYTGKPWETQKAVRIVEDKIWKNAPDGIPGNDDLGEMSSWYVWAAMGMYPEIPGTADLLLGSPLFPHITIHRANGNIVIDAANAASDMPYVHELDVDGKNHDKPWLPATFVAHGGHLRYTLGKQPDKHWGTAPDAAPPSFAPDGN